MGPIQAVKSGFKRYVDFGGRSSRSEYWWWQLLVAIVFLPAIVAAEGNFSDSPLAVKDTNLGFGLAFAWLFKTSETRVPRWE